MRREDRPEPPLPIVQYEDRPGLLDLGWGHPRPELLPIEEWRVATDETLRTYGWEALTYGFDSGPAPLIDWLNAHLISRGDRGADPAETFVTAGASHALELICGVLTEPGDLVVVDSPTYHLAFQIFLDHGVELVAAPADDAGLDPAALADLVRAARQHGRRVPLLYLVPTFGNPTGQSLPDERRRALVEVARRLDLVVVEDDTYRDMVYAGAAPPSLWTLADGTSVVRVGSFAKTVAPGLRLGWLNGQSELVRRVAARGYVHSGGGVNHTVALTMATFGTTGAYERHLSAVRRRYAEQRDALSKGLLAAGGKLDVPDGGWFIWLPLPAGVHGHTLLPIAERNGVAFLPGSVFYASGSGGDDHVRLSFSLLTPADLEEAGGRLAAAIHQASGR